MSDTPSRLPGHLPALDGVRGLAILLVVAHMLGLLVAPTGIFGKAVSLGFQRGWIGVQLFFVLSGFLITGILLDTQKAENYFSGFFARRILRIFPLYYGTLLVVFVILPALGRLPAVLEQDRAHQVWLWTYLSNWVAPFGRGSAALPHFWSLAVEEQFYFLWPLLLRRRTPAGCIKLCLALAVASLAARVIILAYGGSYGAIYMFSITRMDALALGGAAAAALRIPALAERIRAARGRLWPASLLVGVVGALCTHGYNHETPAGATIGYTFLSVMFLGVVLAGAASELSPATPSFLRLAPLRAFGTYSYGIYVFHKPLHDFVGKPLLARLGLDATRSVGVACAYVAVGLIVSLAAAYASYHLFERRFLGLKGRFAPRVAKPTASATG